MKKIILLIIVSLVAVSALGAYYLYESFNVSNIQTPSSGYLTRIPNPFSNESKIFLVSSTNHRYGFYNWNYSHWNIQMGDPCFIVNVTVRNDYTTDPIHTDENSPAGLYYNHVKLTAFLYDQDGRVNSVDVTYPINSLHGGHVFKIEPEETYSVELYMATETTDIERYEIYVAYIGSAMEP